MIKKILATILVLGIVVFVLLQTSYAHKMLSAKNIKNDSLSERSKEFIEDQKNENETWNNANFAKRGAQEPTVVDVDGCFTITVPFRVTTTRKDNTCDFQIATARPKTTIIAYMSPLPGGSLDEESGVRLRRRKKDKYEEYSQKIGDRTFIIFKRKGGAFDRNAFLAKGNSMLVVNIVGLTGEDLTKDFHAMLNSVQFNTVTRTISPTIIPEVTSGIETTETP